MAEATTPLAHPGMDGKRALDHAMDAAFQPVKSEIPVGNDDYRVHLPVFDGPLDLLLHLIRREQVNIYDIPIAKICRAYVEHLEMMQSIDVNIAGEFMVMAATLTLMKSLVLLPNEKADGGEDDPRMPLVAQLIEYERFKKAADQFDARPWVGRDIFVRSPQAVADIMPVESLIDAPIDAVDPYQLLLCLKIATDRTTKPPMQIAVDPTSIKEKVSLIGHLLETQDVVQFESLLPEPDIRHIRDVIVAFLAILELAKLKYIEILQAENLGQIQIRSVRDVRDLNVGMLDQY